MDGWMMTAAESKQLKLYVKKEDLLCQNATYEMV